MDILPLLQTLNAVVAPIAAPLILIGGKMALDEWRRRGHKATYGDAILRAAGVGAAAAQTAGYSPFSTNGLAIAAKEGAEYLRSTVQESGAALGITSMLDHGDRVTAQIKAVQLQAVAEAGTAKLVSPSAGYIGPVSEATRLAFEEAFKTGNPESLAAGDSGTGLLRYGPMAKDNGDRGQV